MTLRLPFRRLLYTGRDRHGAPFAAVAKRHDTPAGPLALRPEVSVTWGGWWCCSVDADGVALGRLWIEWG